VNPPGTLRKDQRRLKSRALRASTPVGGHYGARVVPGSTGCNNEVVGGPVEGLLVNQWMNLTILVEVMPLGRGKPAELGSNETVKHGG